MNQINPESFNRLQINDLIMIYLPYTVKQHNQVKHFKRPAVVVQLADDWAMVFRCTSKFDHKSDEIKARYYALVDWQSEGLSKKTYVDIGEIQRINLTAILRQQPIGKLTVADQVALFNFAQQWQLNHN